jgi:hypothetical protein
MNAISTYRYAVLIILGFVSFILIFTKCINKSSAGEQVIGNVKGQRFAGSAACASCHRDIYEKHRKTPHFLTSVKATAKNIKGSFSPGKNTVRYSYSDLVAMEKRDGSFYQVEYRSGAEKNAQRMDIVIGSGIMGQSYLYWMQDHLYQLPVSYFGSVNRWANSPAFPSSVVYSRFITSRCLECHSTFAKTLSPPDVDPEKFDAGQMIYGVDCEKCHGPAAEHVEFQTADPAEKTAKFIVNPARLSRQQNMDLCSSCHGGRLFKTRPSFEFTVGDTLSNYFDLDPIPPDPNNIDVHGNQNGLLRASNCFRVSATLTCNTCHNTHETERGKTALFSQRCMNCHNEEHGSFCTMNRLPAEELKKNCIDCHMPLYPSQKISVILEGEKAPTAALIRSHYINVYPGETNKILRYLEKK